jgi:hypothetical protein
MTHQLHPLGLIVFLRIDEERVDGGSFDNLLSESGGHLTFNNFTGALKLSYNMTKNGDAVFPASLPQPPVYRYYGYIGNNMS